MAIRFPTQDELNQMFADQLAEDRRKLEAYLLAQGRPLPQVPVPPQAARGEGHVENATILAAVQEQSGTPIVNGVVDVFKSPPQPPVPPGPSRTTDKNAAACQYCGKLFKTRSLGMSVMQRNRHVAKEHPDDKIG